ncbi:hypothetical protein CDD81_626 [Ophiocordyceps australis]|uniref:thioredoxin-dependent peroxiredoxin n=1 Tax=Ophiocordyceps australis TaxID=1399860 RepID=A0A2C5XG06_9HYPO|nr:hypothetical protein CDD81_626 [Ophiocordyceps australis]
MPVELRKRKAPQPPPAPPPATKKTGRVAAAKGRKGTESKKASAKKKAVEENAEKGEETVEASDEKKDAESDSKETESEDKETKSDSKETKGESKEAKSDGKRAKVAVGDVIQVDDFGGEIETNDGSKTTLKKLLDESKAGVVLFTYPKASTPGCTNQACLFRDAYESLTGDGLAIYGLSTDSPKANTTFKDKQRLPFALLCDFQATLIAAIGLKKQPRGTQRGVFAIDKAGKVLVAEAGGPAATVDRVKELVKEMSK